MGEIAAKAAVQLLFSTGKSYTVDGLREKLREFFRQEVRAELRAVAALNNVELITALISFHCYWKPVIGERARAWGKRTDRSSGTPSDSRSERAGHW